MSSNKPAPKKNVYLLLSAHFIGKAKMKYIKELRLQDLLTLKLGLIETIAKKQKCTSLFMDGVDSEWLEMFNKVVKQYENDDDFERKISKAGREFFLDGSYFNYEFNGILKTIMRVRMAGIDFNLRETETCGSNENSKKLKEKVYDRHSETIRRITDKEDWNLQFHLFFERKIREYRDEVVYQHILEAESLENILFMGLKHELTDLIKDPTINTYRLSMIFDKKRDAFRIEGKLKKGLKDDVEKCLYGCGLPISVDIDLVD